ncbi:MAG: hypothetical protein AAGH64_06720 [Planctomycetota bacterium]
MHRPRATLAALLLAPATLLAQDAPAPSDQDGALVPGPEQEEVVLRPTQSGGDAGGDGALAGLDLPDPRPPRGEELPEGTFIRDAQGIVVELTTGGWAFVFDADVNGDADPPMVLQPSMQTASMLRLVSAREDTMTFSVAGQVQRYRGRHYLLPLRFDVVSGEGNTERPSAEERAAEAERVLTDAPSQANVSADDLAARVDALSGEARRAEIPSATLGSEDPDPSASIVPEGELIVDLAGRVTRDGSGLWVFTSDSDADAPPGATEGGLAGEITLLPCLMLQALERDLRLVPGRARLHLSGRVLVFEGANYVLPTLYRLQPDVGGNLTSAQ